MVSNLSEADFPEQPGSSLIQQAAWQEHDWADRVSSHHAGMLTQHNTARGTEGLSVALRRPAAFATVTLLELGWLTQASP